MTIVFLEGGAIALSPLDETDARDAMSLPPRLLPAARPGVGGDRLVAFAARDKATGKLRGRVALESIDWVARRARVTARWGSDATGATEALALVASYAREDINLETLEAEPGDAVWRQALQDAGFRGEGPLASRLVQPK